MTAGELREWRDRHGLTNAELAYLFGIPVATMRGKLCGRLPIRTRTERLTEGIDLLLARGVRPPGWPMRLAHRIFAPPCEYYALVGFDLRV